MKKLSNEIEQGLIEASNCLWSLEKMENKKPVELELTRASDTNI